MFSNMTRIALLFSFNGDHAPIWDALDVSAF